VRAAFVKALAESARADDRIFLLVGDVGYSLVEPFAEEFPERFINVGVAEQNMIGIAAGLALSGKIVFVYSLANFPTLRCVEQLRNDVCYHNADVKVVASGAGLAYGALGATHHVTEDMGIMRMLPNMVVIAPADPVESGLATRAAIARTGPCYLRLAKTGDPLIHHTTPDFQIGKAIVLRDGADVTLIAIGGILWNVVQAAEYLGQQGVQARVLSMHTLKPLDVEAVLRAAAETGVIVAVEEHSIFGGLGSAVSEVLAESGRPPIVFRRIGINDCFCSEVGSQAYLQEVHSLSTTSIVSVVESLLKAASERTWRVA